MDFASGRFLTVAARMSVMFSNCDEQVTQPRPLSQTRLLNSVVVGNVQPVLVAFRNTSAKEDVMPCSRSMLLVVLFGWGSAICPDTVAEDSLAPRSPATKSISGREIFLREWLPGDPRSHGGDGLGPVFNDTSCVACHNQGGVGGGGAEGKNVLILTASLDSEEPDAVSARLMRLPEQIGDLLEPFVVMQQQTFFGKRRVSLLLQTPPMISFREKRNALLWSVGELMFEIIKSTLRVDDLKTRHQEQLRKIHPGLASARSVILHKSATDEEYARWRLELFNDGEDLDVEIASLNALNTEPGSTAILNFGIFQLPLLTSSIGGSPDDEFPPIKLLQEILSTEIGAFNFPTRRGDFVLTTTQRNSIALFGAGLIDQIPDQVLEQLAENQAMSAPGVSGRVARLKGGKIGRFGWKAQKASLHDFTMTACAVELGLHVPDHNQAGAPHRPDYQPTGYDLDQDECAALVKFLEDLPAPVQNISNVPLLADRIQDGEKIFDRIGCAVCHVPKLGNVTGLYSDLLLHDLGPLLADTGSYGVFAPNSPSESDDEVPLELTAINPFPIGFILGSKANSFSTEEPKPPKFGAGIQEWRTPPLWGVRDSAPYLHDGRAKTLEQAIAMHGGEGHQAAINFFQLSKGDQTRVLSFLRTLVAPEAAISGTR